MDLPLCAKLIYAAIRGESIPVDSVLSIKQTGLMARQGAELKEQYHLLALRARCMGAGYCMTFRMRIQLMKPY